MFPQVRPRSASAGTALLPAQIRVETCEGRAARPNRCYSRLGRAGERFGSLQPPNGSHQQPMM